MEGNTIRLSLGLEGKDLFWDELSSMYEQLQISSAEAGNLAEDIITFSTRTVFFAVIEKRIPFGDVPPLGNGDSKKKKNKKSNKNKKGKGQEEKPAEDSIAEDELGNSVDATKENKPNETSCKAQENPRKSALSYPRKQTLDLDAELEASGPKDPLIGLVYLLPTSNPDLISHHAAGGMSIGIVLKPEERGRGYAREALELVVACAFDKMGCHRVQALVLDNCYKNTVLRLFTQLGFRHEGTRRRSYYSSMECEWKDLTSLAILDTDWVMRAYFKPAPTSLWDELFDRHEKERQELLKWEDEALREQKRLVRSISIETIHVLTDTEVSASEPDPVVDLSPRAPTSPAETLIEFDGDSEADGDVASGQQHPRFYDTFNVLNFTPSPGSPTFSEQSLGSATSASSSSDSGDSTTAWDMLDSDFESPQSTSFGVFERQSSS